MTIKETAAMMCSEDYKERFKAEYYQLLIRYNKLRHMLIMWQGDSLDFKPACPRNLYELQARAMSDYLAILEARALIEDIDLEECVKYDD